MTKVIIKFFGLLIISLILTACSPNEADFKSKLPVSDRGSVVSQSWTGDEADSKITNQKSKIEPPLAPSQRRDSAIKEINWDVPFFPQAPDADWALPWQEACEEAASVLAYHFATQTPLGKEEFKKQILELVAWENERFGDYQHTNIEQTAEMIRDYWNFSDLRILENPTIEDLKTELAAGRVLIAPFAGRDLRNPFYSNQGPLYHMMVIKGYDEKNFIVNDVGTRRGHNFIYPYATIMNAMHEWHDKDIHLGEKKVIVIGND